jgi:hypothetical protein
MYDAAMRGSGCGVEEDASGGIDEEDGTMSARGEED